jgi:hypothetical protein
MTKKKQRNWCGEKGEKTEREATFFSSFLRILLFFDAKIAWKGVGRR